MGGGGIALLRRPGDLFRLERFEVSAKALGDLLRPGDLPALERRPGD